jgi:integrase
LPGNHGLRHSFCALAFHLGWDESAVMQVGGWDDPGVVHGIYKHLAAKDKAKNVDAMKQFYQTITKDK